MPITQEDIERYIGRQILEHLDLTKRLKEAEEQIRELSLRKENKTCENLQ